MADNLPNPPPFPPGPCLYIFSRVGNRNCFKVGTVRTDINSCIATARATSLPDLQPNFLLYTENTKLVEALILGRFRSQMRSFFNHGVIFDVELDDLVGVVMKVVAILGLHVLVENVDAVTVVRAGSSVI